jgi:hypothetical protein
MSLSRSLILFGAAALLLSACGEVREDLGLGRNPPDEFAVVEHPPLSMPPDFGLRPPRPGAVRPQAVDTDRQANAALFGNTNASSDTGAESGAEKALLEASGGAKADSRHSRNRRSRGGPEGRRLADHLVQSA